jgi:hypothetical protein
MWQERDMQLPGFMSILQLISSDEKQANVKGVFLTEKRLTLELAIREINAREELGTKKLER